MGNMTQTNLALICHVWTDSNIIVTEFAMNTLVSLGLFLSFTFAYRTKQIENEWFTMAIVLYKKVPLR